MALQYSQLQQPFGLYLVPLCIVVHLWYFRNFLALHQPRTIFQHAFEDVLDNL